MARPRAAHQMMWLHSSSAAPNTSVSTPMPCTCGQAERRADAARQAAQSSSGGCPASRRSSAQHCTPVRQCSSGAAEASSPAHLITDCERIVAAHSALCGMAGRERLTAACRLQARRWRSRHGPSSDGPMPPLRAQNPPTCGTRILDTDLGYRDAFDGQILQLGAGQLRDQLDRHCGAKGRGGSGALRPARLARGRVCPGVRRGAALAGCPAQRRPRRAPARLSSSRSHRSTQHAPTRMPRPKRTMARVRTRVTTPAMHTWMRYAWRLTHLLNR